ncbi:M20 family peptidase [Candidatus Heimdallarchaeota archaeon]|nr:MAG: M20 family peptidase [Candidatus Heimdallarchaeota archaeon]
MISEEDVIPILKDLIKIKTENPPGNTLKAANYIKNLLESNGIETIIQNYAEERANVIAYYGKGSNTVILTGHLDTVPSGDESKWKFPPFDAEERGGKIYGRGATDMKGADAAFLAVLIALKRNNIRLSKKVIFLGTSDEEIGMDGSLAAKEDGIMEGCEFVLIGEPTELQLGVVEKGTFWVKVKVYGKSAHGSTPHLGISAIEGAAELIPRMKEIIPDFIHDLMGKSTLNIGKISGGTLINVVPEYCEFRCDYRLVADTLREEIKLKLQKLLDEFNNKGSSRAEFEIIHEVPAIELKREDNIVRSLKQKAINFGKDKIIALNYGTDGAMLVPDYDVPFVIMGPGKLDQLHVTDEYTEKQEVIDYANIVYEALIETYS